MNLPEPIEISFDENNYNQNLAMYESRIEHFQNIINKIKAAVPNIVFRADDLTPLFINPLDFLASKIITEPTTVGGIELDKVKVFELLSCTDELKQIISEIEVLNSNQETQISQRFLDRHAKYYFINNADAVEIKQDTLASIKNQNTVYIKTEKQKSLYEAIKKIADAFNEINHSKLANTGNIQAEFLEFSNNGNVSIKHQSILRY